MPELPGALGIFSAEGGQFLNGHGFFRRGETADRGSLYDLWDGKAFGVQGLGMGLSSLPGRRVAFHLTVQPDARGRPFRPGLARPGLFVAPPDSRA